jgi:hypothetical protein
MISDTDAAIVGAVIAGVIGSVSGLGGVWLGFYLSRRGSEADRRAEKLLAVYTETEFLANLLVAFQKQKIGASEFYRKWATTTEKMMRSLIGSGLDRKRILKAINGKWDDPKSVTELKALADDLLEKVDPDYARAARELCVELGVKPEDIEPIILPRDPRP